ncbi:MAG: hypothetical protein ACLTYN_05210 [Dysosmobacter welbionis]
MGFANLCGTGAPLCSIYRARARRKRPSGSWATPSPSADFRRRRHRVFCCSGILLYLFGASDATYPYAEAYMTIYLLGPSLS